MKTVQINEEKKSLFRKLIDAFKNTALYTMFFDDTAGIAIDTDSANSDAKLAYLSQSSGLTSDEVKAISAAFEDSALNLEKLVYRVEPKDKNPFKVEEKDLNHDVSPEVSERAQGEISRDDR